MPSIDELQIVYKAIDQMTAVQQKILTTQEKMIARFTEMGNTSGKAGEKMSSSMKKGGELMSSVEGQIAKINRLFGFMGLQLETIDIYMISAFKVTALWKLLGFAKNASEEFTKLNSAMRGVASLTEYMGGVPADALASLEAMATKHKISVLSLAQSYRNLVLRGYDLKQIEAVMDSLLKAGVVLGTQAMMPVEIALERVTEGLLGQRSAATDNMNMTKNLEDMHKDFAKTMGDEGEVLTDNIKKQGEVAYFTSLNAVLTPRWAEEMEGLTGKIKETNKALEGFTLRSGKDLLQFRVYVQQVTTALIKLANYIINGWEQIAYTIGYYVYDVVVPDLKLVAVSFVNLSKLVGAAMKDIWNAITFKSFTFEHVKIAFDNMLKSIEAATANYQGKVGSRLEHFIAGLKEIQDKIKAPEPLVAVPPPTGITAPVPAITPVDVSKLTEYSSELRKLTIDNIDRTIEGIEAAVQKGIEALSKAYPDPSQWMKYELGKLKIVKAGEAKIAALRASSAQQEKEVEIRHQLSLLEIQRNNLEISSTEYYQKKATLLQTLLEQEKEYLTHLEKIGDTAAWRAQVKEIDSLSASLAEVNIKLKELSGTFAEGITFGFKKFIDEAQTSYQGGVALVEGITSSITTSLNTIFTDFRNRDLKSWHSYVTKFADMITDALQQIIVKMIALKVIGATIGIFDLPSNTPGAGKIPGYPKAGAGAVFHEGGLIERFHAGTGKESSLKTDEILAILQTRERVLSRKQNTAFESLGQSSSKEVIEKFHIGSGMGSSIKTDEILAILQTRERVLSKSHNTVFEFLGKSSNIAPSNIASSNIAPSIVNYFTFPSIDQSSVASFIYQNKDKIADALMTTMRGNHPFRR